MSRVQSIARRYSLGRIVEAEFEQPSAKELILRGRLLVSAVPIFDNLSLPGE